MNACAACTGAAPLVSATITQQDSLASFDAVHLLALSVSAKISVMAIDAIFGTIDASWPFVESSLSAAVMTVTKFLLSTDSGGLSLPYAGWKTLLLMHCCCKCLFLYQFCAADEHAVPYKAGCFASFCSLCVTQHTASCLNPLWLQLLLTRLLSVSVMHVRHMLVMVSHMVLKCRVESPNSV